MRCWPLPDRLPQEGGKPNETDHHRHASRAGRDSGRDRAHRHHRPFAPERRRPVWSSLVVSLAVIGAVSWEIGDDHMGQPGADVLMWGSPFLLGMAIMGALIALRIRRGLD
jgi:hypothetical protein